MKRFTHIVAPASILALSGGVLAGDHTHEGDIVLRVRHGRIITGTEGGGFRRAQVFGSELGAEGFPNSTKEPGFDNDPETFTPDTAIGFNVPAPLGAWSGAGFGPTSGEVMEIAYGPIGVTTAHGPVAGFFLPVDDKGDWHEHYEFTLLPGPGAGIVGDGVYLLALNLVSTDPGVRRSIPFWIVFNQNAPEQVHDDAIEWARVNLVPAPGAAALALLAGATIRRQRPAPFRTAP